MSSLDKFWYIINKLGTLNHITEMFAHRVYLYKMEYKNNMKQ